MEIEENSGRAGAGGTHSCGARFLARRDVPAAERGLLPASLLPESAAMQPWLERA